MLIDNKLLKRIDPVEISEDEYSYDQPLAWEIKSGYVWYGDTRFKDAAFKIIKKIEEIENHHEHDKKYAQEEGRSLDPSISKKHIDDQIMSRPLYCYNLPERWHGGGMSSSSQFQMYYEQVGIPQAFLPDPPTQ
ncbi:unnamed protein product [Cuscuta epithymum]|uniref:DNA-directed RNA polymerase n=1 Tax=Cuscuta epithymum TaxID=186058 RepID=A0AAV0DS22_9ASTE|nr:unnamed protein product [Cuscuta epithymum]